jgi:HK97 family phage portal protein
MEAGMYLTTDEALKVSAVWCAMDTIVRAMAPCPWLVYDVDGAQDTRTLRRTDPLAYILNTRANPWTTAIAFREGLLWSALGYGNGYAEIQYDRAGRVAWLWNLDPQRVGPEINPQTGELAYKIQQITGGTVWAEPWRIYHLRGPSLSGYVGDNVLARASRSIGAAAAAQQFAAAYFGNGTIMSGYWTQEKMLPPAVKEAFEKDWKDKHSSPANAFKSPVLPPGMKWTPVGVEPEKAQLIETRQFSIPDIARWFGVPLHKLMDPQGSQGYGTNIEQLGVSFINDALHPWAERCEQEADWKLLPPRPATRETKIDLSRHKEGDAKTQADALTIYKKAGVLSQNEIREIKGWNTVGPEGDVYLVESTMQTVERAIEGPPEPPPPALPPPREPREDDEEDAPERKATNAALVTARDVIVATLSDAFARHERRIANHRAKHRGVVTDDDRASLRARLTEDCASVLALAKRAGVGDAGSMELGPFSDAIEAGEPPDKAAERFIGHARDVA